MHCKYHSYGRRGRKEGPQIEEQGQIRLREFRQFDACITLDLDPGFRKKEMLRYGPKSVERDGNGCLYGSMRGGE